MARPMEDIELNEMHERGREEARHEDDEFRDAEDRFENDFDRLRNDYQITFERDNFSMRHDPTTGDYEIIYNEDPGDLCDKEELKKEIKKKLTYVGLRHVYRRLFDGEGRVNMRLPSYDFLERNNFFDQINLRFNEEGNLKGSSYKGIARIKPVNVIVKRPNMAGLRFSMEKGSEEAVREFKDRLKTFKEVYDLTPGSMNDQIINENVFGVFGG